VLWLYLTALLPVILLVLLFLYHLVVASLPRERFTPIGKTILLVDDDPKSCQVTGRKLVQHGFLVLLATDGETALRIAKAYPHKIDALITDIIMPGMSGPLLAEQLLTVRPLTPVLFISGLAEEDSVPQRTQEGMGFLTKPFSIETLSHKVRHILEPAGHAA